eukprot:9500346-Pyramimonas_sp.AAC.2
MDSSKTFRKELVSSVRSLWPREITVDDASAAGALHLGHDPNAEVNEETVQFASCAMSRMTDYLEKGAIPAHLQRNKVVQKRVRKRVRKRPACKDPTHGPSVFKRPAAASR